MLHNKSTRYVVLCLVTLMFAVKLAFSASAGEIHTRKDSPTDFNTFLASCSVTEKLALLGALGEKAPASVSDYDSAIRKGLIYRAYSKASYLFRSDKAVDYHEIAVWAAKGLGIEGNIERLSTFELESKIIRKIAEQNGMDVRSLMSSTLIATVPGPAIGQLLSWASPKVKDVTTFIMAVHSIKVDRYGDR